MLIAETDRLYLRHMRADDAGFLLALLNSPAYLQFIGDRQVRDIASAKAYWRETLAKSYLENGFGLNVVEFKSSSTPIGICGLIRRPDLPDVDIGFAFLPQYFGQGYAFEAAQAVMEQATKELGFTRIIAITTPLNTASQKLLKRLGMIYEEEILYGDAQTTLWLYGWGPKAP